jgi:hypothetical protein
VSLQFTHQVNNLLTVRDREHGHSNHAQKETSSSAQENLQQLRGGQSPVQSKKFRMLAV